MLKLTGFDVVLATAGNLYLLLALVGVCIALWKGKTWALKLLFAALVLAVFIAPIAPEIYRGVEYRKKLATAQAMFAERCKTAGEKINKTVENVEGIYLMKVRPSEMNYGDQFNLDDPYGRDLGGDGYIESFTRGQYAATHIVNPNVEAPARPQGYSYVEALDPKDGKRYRYTGGMKVVGQKDASAPNVQIDIKRNPNFDLNIYSFVLDRQPVSGNSPRYGVTYDDISTREEREYWIAGSSLKVIDLHTNEVIGERIGYMVDWAQGSNAGQRSPWLLAANNACPQFGDRHGASAQPSQTTRFVEKVLRPSK